MEKGLISSAQLEAVLYANMCFKVFLEGPGDPTASQHPFCSTLPLIMSNTCNVCTCSVAAAVHATTY